MCSNLCGHPYSLLIKEFDTLRYLLIHTELLHTISVFNSSDYVTEVMDFISFSLYVNCCRNHHMLTVSKVYRYLSSVDILPTCTLSIPRWNYTSFCCSTVEGRQPNRELTFWLFLNICSIPFTYMFNFIHPVATSIDIKPLNSKCKT